MKYNIILLVVIIGPIFLACHKNNNSPFSGPAPVILSISPDSGHYSTVLTITGNYFDSVASGNLVTIDSVPAVVQRVTNTTLTVLVPGTHTGKVAVKTSGGLTTGPIFTYTMDILVSGWLYNSVTGGYSTAYYWDNGVPIALTNGLNNAIGNAIVSSGNNIYVAGYEYYGANKVAKVWKNGTAISLTSQGQDANANAIQISDTNVYVAGYANNGSVDVATVWINSAATALTNGTTNAYATSLAISGKDVYVAGYQSNGSHNVAMVWKNGVGAALTNGTSDACATAIAVTNNAVYVAGYMGNSPYAHGDTPVYWINGTNELLPPIISDGQAVGALANAISIGRNGVYIGGYTDTYFYAVTDNFYQITGLVWHNEAGFYYAPASVPTYGLFVDSTDIYVAGSGPAYWKNSVATSLSNGQLTGNAYSIFIRY